VHFSSNASPYSRERTSCGSSAMPSLFELSNSSFNYDQQVDYANGNAFAVWPPLSINTEQTIGNTPGSSDLGTPSTSPSLSYSSPFPFSLSSYQQPNITPLFPLSSSPHWSFIPGDGPPEADDVHRSAGQWSTTPAMRNAPPDVLEPYFTTVGERNLVSFV